MAKILKFVYVPILYLSILLVLTIYDQVYFNYNPPCVSDKDCPSPKSPKSNIRCRQGYCVNLYS
ncbi:putative Late nodulin [Medicago truncatula]|uniref:Putative Late nodulin n=1 Tax=Medicago truncatula TaxID=3880 RepID=A0A396GZN7_MEDTR|nr:putative Late nodulin [Medicago truncatula]